MRVVSQAEPWAGACLTTTTGKQAGMIPIGIHCFSIDLHSGQVRPSIDFFALGLLRTGIIDHLSRIERIFHSSPVAVTAGLQRILVLITWSRDDGVYVCRVVRDMRANRHSEL